MTDQPTLRPGTIAVRGGVDHRPPDAYCGIRGFAEQQLSPRGIDVRIVEPTNLAALAPAPG